MTEKSTSKERWRRFWGLLADIEIEHRQKQAQREAESTRDQTKAG